MVYASGSKGSDFAVRFAEQRLKLRQKSNYSKRLKTECSVFGAFRSHSVVESLGFRTTSEIGTKSFGFQTFGLVSSVPFF